MLEYTIKKGRQIWIKPISAYDDIQIINPFNDFNKHFCRRVIENSRDPIYPTILYFIFIIYQCLGCFISIVREFHMGFFALGQSICIIKHIWESWVPSIEGTVFYKVPNMAVFHFSLFLRCLYFHILVATNGFLSSVHCIWTILRYLKRCKARYVFFNCYWAEINTTKCKIWVVSGPFF